MQTPAWLTPMLTERIIMTTASPMSVEGIPGNMGPLHGLDRKTVQVGVYSKESFPRPLGNRLLAVAEGLDLRQIQGVCHSAEGV